MNSWHSNKELLPPSSSTDTINYLGYWVSVQASAEFRSSALKMSLKCPSSIKLFIFGFLWSKCWWCFRMMLYLFYYIDEKKINVTKDQCHLYMVFFSTTYFLTDVTYILTYIDWNIWYFFSLHPSCALVYSILCTTSSTVSALNQEELRRQRRKEGHGGAIPVPV